MKRMKLLIVGALLGVGTAFGEAYDPVKHGNPIVVTSGVVEIDGNGTVIDGRGSSRCATLGPDVTLRNFTLKNGCADWGGGVSGGRLVNCRIENCAADLGGGASEATLEDCTIVGCTAVESGAALYGCAATGCTLERNKRPVSSSLASVHGGIAFGSTLTSCQLVENAVEVGPSAPVIGGLGERLTLTGCAFTGNTVSGSLSGCYGIYFADTTLDGVAYEFRDTLAQLDDPPVPTDPWVSDEEPTEGMGMVGRYYAAVYLDLLDGRLKRTYDAKTKVAAEGLPSGLKLVKTAVEGAYSYQIEGVPTEALNVAGVPRLAYIRITDSQKQVTFVPLTGLRVGPAFVAEFPPATNRVAYDPFDISHIWPRYATDKSVWTFSGWPTGLKLTAGTLSGTPKKVGRFTIKAVEKITGTSYKSTHLASLVVAYEDGELPPETSVQSVEPAALPSAGLTNEINDIHVGVSYSWAVSNATSATVSASGLPSGLKLATQTVKDPVSGVKTKSYVIKGVPTKAGFYLSTIVTKLKSATAKRTVAFRVIALPTWAQGTFDGGADETFAVGGQASLTIAKAGKLSGKWASLGTNWTVTATAYDRCLTTPATQYVASVVFKAGSGKKALLFTNELTVAEDAICGGIATNALFLAYLNRWKADPWKTIGKKLAKAEACVITPQGTADITLTLKAAASGKVSVKGRFGTYSATGSAVLCPQTLPDQNGAFKGVAFFYFPPKGKMPLAGGFSACIRLAWDGAQLTEDVE